MATTQSVAVKLELGIRVRIQQLAKAQNRSAHYLTRAAIAQYVEREEQRKALRQDALKAWPDYQETGQHLPYAEAHPKAGRPAAKMDPEFREWLIGAQNGKGPIL